MTNLQLAQRIRPPTLAAIVVPVILTLGWSHADESESKPNEVNVMSGQAEVRPSGLPAPPESTTSFGAAIAGGHLYVYGGHTGSAHSYSIDEQSDRFFSLDLETADAGWTTLPSGPRLQGLALVGYGDEVIRVGGFTAMNRADEEQDLRSSAAVARYSPTTGAWQNLPPLPQPRSSLDAVVDGSTLFVLGGWTLGGNVMGGNEKEGDANAAVWLDEGVSLDLANPDAGWQSMGSGAPFSARRAISTAVLHNEVFLIGGMLPTGKTTREVLIYDPAAKTWRVGPEVPGDAMDGFGTASCVLNGHLYVNTINGYLHRLSTDGQAWETIAKVEPARFFHRMIGRELNPAPELMLIGGVNMSTGKFDDIDAIVLKR